MTAARKPAAALAEQMKLGFVGVQGATREHAAASIIKMLGKAGYQVISKEKLAADKEAARAAARAAVKPVKTLAAAPFETRVFECQLCGMRVREDFRYSSRCPAWDSVRQVRAAGTSVEYTEFHLWRFARTVLVTA